MSFMDGTVRRRGRSVADLPPAAAERKEQRAERRWHDVSVGGNLSPNDSQSPMPVWEPVLCQNVKDRKQCRPKQP